MTQLTNPDKSRNLNHDIEGWVTHSRRVTWTGFATLAMFHSSLWKWGKFIAKAINRMGLLCFYFQHYNLQSAKSLKGLLSEDLMHQNSWFFRYPILYPNEPAIFKISHSEPRSFQLYEGIQARFQLFDDQNISWLIAYEHITSISPSLALSFKVCESVSKGWVTPNQISNVSSWKGIKALQWPSIIEN